MDRLLTPIIARDWLLVLPVVLPLLGAAILLMVHHLRNLPAGFAMAVVVAMLVCEGNLFMRTLAEGPVGMTMGGWLPPFGISFVADVMGAGFAFVAAFLTLFVLLYIQMDRNARDGKDGLFALVLVLLAGVTGAFLTGDLFNLYVWFEVLLIASFGLMVIAGHPVQLDGAVKYGLLNVMGTMIFLVALGLLYGATGTLNMADLIAKAPLADPVPMAVIAALLLLAFGAKAALFPVNAWLPASYHEAPPAISALFAGLLTKVGVYALLRCFVMVLPDSRAVLEPVILVLAALTMLIAPLGAMAETNLRRAIGFLLIGGIGVALVGLALPTQHGVAGAAVYVVHAMLTMTALYLAAGLIEKRTGQVDSRFMGGLYGSGSLLSIVFFVLILSAAGVPPLLGFWPKLLLLTAATQSANLFASAPTALDWPALALLVALLCNAILTLIAGTRLWAHVFWRAGPEGALSEQPNTALRPLTRRETWFGLAPLALLVAILFAIGLMPNGLFAAGTAAARTLLDPIAYQTAIGLGETR